MSFAQSHRDLVHEEMLHWLLQSGLTAKASELDRAPQQRLLFEGIEAAVLGVRRIGRRQRPELNRSGRERAPRSRERKSANEIAPQNGRVESDTRLATVRLKPDTTTPSRRHQVTAPETT